MKPLVLLLSAATALAAPAVATSGQMKTASVTLQVRSSAYGKILFDGRGYVLYAFSRDAGGKSNCYGRCAARWPVYFARGGLLAGAGVRKALLGTTRRANGRLQVTYAGRPLYYYTSDTKPGLILCQNVHEFGGLWLVVGAGGAVVR